MENPVCTAGNTGPDVRSDCQVSLSRIPGESKVELASKVKTLYGDFILEQANRIVRYYNLKDVRITIDDSGALPFVISARMEAAIRQTIQSGKEYLPDMLPEATYSSVRDRFRLTRLYLPGNTPKLMINAGIHNPDGVILDLEDSVAPDRKFEARILVRNALRQLNFFGAERMVRINQLPAGMEDVAALLPHNVHVFLIPKCERAEEVKELSAFIERECNKIGMEAPFLMPIIESALGIENAFNIASSSEQVIALAIGLEDYTADIGVMRTREGRESVWARQRLVNACKAAGIQAIDSVYSDVSDMDGLLENARASRAMGFEGMGCIHPRQIQVIRQGFIPEQAEIEKAQKIVEAYEDARAKGLGVIALGSKMIDPPVVKRALKTLELLKAFQS